MSAQVCAAAGDSWESCACDYRAGSDIDEYIIGGEQSREFAATGSLEIGSGLCTATLVAPSVVLTAAHCVYGRSTGQMAFSIGMSSSSPAIRRGVVRADVHPGYIPFDSNNPSTFRNGKDLAVLHLEAPIQEVAPVALYLSDVRSLVGTTLRLVGYGATDVVVTPTEPLPVGSGFRRSATVRLEGLEPEQLYYVNAGMGACSGDSGGPAFAQVNGGDWLQVGVTSFGDVLCEQRGWYQRLDIHADWLRSVAGELSVRTPDCSENSACDGLCAFDQDCAALLCPGGSCPSSNGSCRADGVCEPQCGNVDADCNTGGGVTDPCVAYGLHGNGVCDRQCPQDPDCSSSPPPMPMSCQPQLTQVSGNQCAYISGDGRVCGTLPLVRLAFDPSRAACVAIDSSGTACGFAPASAHFDPVSGVCTYVDPLGQICGQAYAYCDGFGCRC